MKDIILFDLDGTLTDPKEGITKCAQYALAHFGIKVDDLQELMPFIGPPLIESFQEFYGLSYEQAEEAVLKYRERFKDIGIFENGVYEGGKELLSICKTAGKTVCLATSKPEIYARRILERYELSQYFDEAVGSTMDGSINTKAEVIREAFRRLNIESEADKAKTIMIGDRKHDILGAKACGIQSVGVHFGYAEPGELEEAGADYMVDTIEELKDLCIRL